MKKIFAAAAIALCFASNSFAQESAGGQSASDSAFGEIGNEEIVAGVVGVGILAAMVANNRGDSKFKEPEDIICGPGEELIDGVCTPIVTPPPLTTTVTTSVTTSVTSTTTTPVTVSATTTSL